MNDADRAGDIVAKMSLEDKVALACGDFAAVAHLGLPPLSFTDGGNGVRVADDATAFPACVSLAAAFDEQLAYRFGSAVGYQARSAGHNVLLGPALDIARTPLAGRQAEAFGEDPYLTASLGAAYVRGVQGHVVAMVKHFVVNNFETGRTGSGWPPSDRGPAVDVHVSRRALEEIYFPPFRRALLDAGAGSVMGSYNQVNGCYACQNPELLGTLKDQWGWTGFVAPDFMFAVRDPLAAARAGLDLPGLDDAEGRRPEDFTSGRIGRDRLDDVVTRMVSTMVTHGLLDRPAAVPGPPAAESLELAAETAVAGSVLLVNRAAGLPLGEGVRSLAVIGPAGLDAIYVMGGSPAVKLHPERVVTPLAGIRQRAGSGVRVEHAQGSWGDVLLPAIPPARLSAPAVPGTPAGPGVLAEYVDGPAETPAVTEARAWLVMSSYNAVNGTTATENDLLETPLNSEWGFDGVVISDWTAVRSLESARASQDLVMPGPDGPWGDALAEAVRSGEIPEAVIDRKVARILALACRVGALDGFPAAEPAWVEDGIAFARHAAIEGTVLLENRGELPWDPARLRSVAVIGDNAANARTQGGGSATVLPEYTVSPLDGLRAALPGADVTYSLGAVVQEGLAELPLAQMTNPATGGPGLRARFLGADGTELFTEDRRSSMLVWFGGDAPIGRSATVELATRFTPAESGPVRVGFAAVGHGKVYVDGELIVDEIAESEHADLGAALMAPPTAAAEVNLTAGGPVELRFEYDLAGRTGPLAELLWLRFGTEPAAVDSGALIAAAAEAAAKADVALVVVGTNSVVESEGYDRGSLALPGRQDDLVRAVAAANPRTVVLVNAGSPVLMPWRNQVAAVLVGYFGGQEFGHAVADVLLGVAEPGGRLPTTWPAAQSDVPVLSTTPIGGALDYAEGIHIGYRAWLRQDAAPAYWFGSGQGYTDIALAGVHAPASVAAGASFPVTVEVENRGGRDGKQIVQIYAERPDSAVDRPVRWLVGFGAVRIPAGGKAELHVSVSTRLLAYWQDGWRYEPGVYQLRVGTSAVDLPLSAKVELA